MGQNQSPVSQQARALATMFVQLGTKEYGLFGVFILDLRFVSECLLIEPPKFTYGQMSATPELAHPLQASTLHQGWGVWPSISDLACLRPTYTAGFRWSCALSLGPSGPVAGTLPLDHRSPLYARV
ncbi:hypothetical protein AVEN_173654-1 [Araneus ventricosus]|uniref:Uncharacterized protein n=1 Tax=Araneus ventricosus TaxID=182803 RepID=A0A4Y2PL23_ARAVE|nr:hypothetical protein AVEN_173654-1 [Araneus ventricosus]